MAKIERKEQKIFGANAPADDIAALGSFKTGTPVYTNDISALQNEAYEQGFGAALVANEAPFMEEQNSIPYVLSKQLAYIFQEGMPEWDANTIYYTDSNCKRNGVWYKSLTNENTGNDPASDTQGTNWEKMAFGGGSNLPLGFSTYQGDNVMTSTEWLVSNGQYNSGTIYSGFYDTFSTKIGQPFGAGYVRAHTDEYTDYDLVINTEDVTFRLPLLNGSEDLLSDKTDDLSSQLSNNAEFTAPANGWYAFAKYANAANQNVSLQNLTRTIYTISHGSWAGTGCRTILEVKKGDVIQVSYDAGGTLSYFKFIYAKGNGNLYYYVGNNVINQEDIDIAEVTNALANKVDSTNTEWAVSACMPDYTRYIDNIFTTPYISTTVQSYTTPANGFICLNIEGQTGFVTLRIGGNTGCTFVLGIQGTNIFKGWFTHQVWVPKNTSVEIYSNSNNTYKAEMHRFVYAKGEAA